MKLLYAGIRIMYTQKERNKQQKAHEEESKKQTKRNVLKLNLSV